MDLEERIKNIEERNKRVEIDKEWETSFTRTFFIGLFTYLAIGIYLYLIEAQKPFINSIVPTIGFMLSTLTMPFIKKRWLIIKANKLKADS